MLTNASTASSRGDAAQARAIGPRIATSTGEIFLKSNGIIECVNRSTEEHTLKHAQENVNACRQVAGGKKRPVLIDLSIPAPQTAECRAYYSAPATAEVALAFAMVTNSTLGRIIANFLLGLHVAPIPMKLFGTRAEAEAWLRTFL